MGSSIDKFSEAWNVEALVEVLQVHANVHKLEPDHRAYSSAVSKKTSLKSCLQALGFIHFDSRRSNQCGRSCLNVYDQFPSQLLFLCRSLHQHNNHDNLGATIPIYFRRIEKPLSSKIAIAACPSSTSYIYALQLEKPLIQEM